MKKNITKEQIIDITLLLINEKEGIHEVNLREIARKLGCAHTNIYNYFGDFEELLWRAVETALLRLGDYVTADIEAIPGEAQRLEYFFSRFIDFYLNNRGIFKLIWLERIKGSKPKESSEISRQIALRLSDVIYQLYRDVVTPEEAHYILHTAHCYVYGEIAIFISGRGLIKEEERFRAFVLKECQKIIRLLVAELQREKSGQQQGRIAHIDNAF